jgi:hypothetical protein
MAVRGQVVYLCYLEQPREKIRVGDRFARGRRQIAGLASSQCLDAPTLPIDCPRLFVTPGGLPLDRITLSPDKRPFTITDQGQPTTTLVI